MYTKIQILKKDVLFLCTFLFTSLIFSQTADFNVQHVQNDIGNSGGTNTSFTSVSSLNNAFALANNNRKVSAGPSGSGGNTPGDDLSGARVLTGTGTLSYYRQASSSGANMRFNSSIWEYIGPPGGDNEMIVRGRYAVTLNGGTNSTTTLLGGIVNANKCIPFITGITTNLASAGADAGTAVAYLENATTLRVQKGTNTNNVTVYVTIVEFTGSNWTVLHGDSGNTAADTGTITLRDGSDGTGTATNVSSWNNAIIFSHHRGDNTNNGVNQAIEDNWPLMDPGSNNQRVDWRFQGGHLSNGTNRQFVHVLANTDLNVTRYQNTSNTANETTIPITSAGLSSVNEALIIGSSISTGGGTAYGRGWRNYYFNSATQAAHWSHRDGNTMAHEIQIVDLSGLTSTVAGPEINILGNATSIPDEDLLPSLADDTDFGDVDTASGSQTHTFTIQNTGTTDLNLTDASPYVNITGTHAADFSIATAPTTPISASGTTTFQITFNPSADGLRTATISIANNDLSEDPYNFSIQGTGTTPSYCDVTGASTAFEYIGNVTLNTITNNSGVGTTGAGYSDFTAITTNLTQGSAYPISITPIWPGTLYNEAFAVYIDFNQDFDFTDPGELVFTAGPDQISPQTGIINIPGTATVGTTRMRVIMDDVTAVTGPCVVPNFGEVEDYTINIVASSPLAEINITGNGNSITDGDITPDVTDNTDFGNVDIAAGTRANTFIIENLGSVNPLNLLGISPYVSIGGTHATDFTVTTIPSNTITAGNNTVFVITFNPSALGLRTATVSIANDDTDENPYTFSIQGTGFVPPPCGVTVLHTAGFEINNDGWTLGGSDASRQNTATRSYENNYSIRLRNTGNMTLTGLDFNGYDKVDLEFFFYAQGMEINKTFVTEYRENSSAAWQQITLHNSSQGDATKQDGDFHDGVFYAKIATLMSSDFTFPPTATAEIRFRILGSDTTDTIFIDKINVSGTVFCTPTLAPGGITSGLTVWLKADEITGTTVQTDNTNVNTWFDTAEGHNAKVSDPTSAVISKPVFKNNPTDNINFNPVVAFDNNPASAPKSFTYLESGRDALHATSGFNTQELYIVVVPDITVNSSLFPPMDLFCAQNEIRDLWDEDVTGYGFGDYSARFDNEMVAYADGTNPTPSPSDPTLRGYGIAETGSTVYNSNSVLVLSARNTSAGTSQELFMNGNNIGVTEVGVPQFANSTNRRFWLGRSQAYAGSFNGRIAEVISYNSRVNDGSERPRIESYLAVKYGITQGINGVSTDYVNSDGTVIWDQSADLATYNYDIAGIGRDDASALNQKQSRSINYEVDGGGRTRGIMTVGLSDIYDTNYDNRTSNLITLNDKEFLMWGNDGTDLNLAATTVMVNMSSGTAPVLTTEVTFTAMQRVWKFVETGGDIPKVKISIPNNAIRNITPPGSYYMFISDTGIFDPTADYRVMTDDGAGNLETEYDFDGTKYVTFGYAPQVVVERSIYFDGASDYIDVEDRLDLNPANFTVSAWIKRDVADTGIASIVSKRDAAFTEGYDLRILDDNRIEILWKNGSDQSLISNTSLPDDQWHQVAVIYDGARVSIYIDGVEDNSDTRTPPVDTDESFYIAAAGKNTPTQYFRGNIDEVRVWDVALSAAQLRFIMNQEISDNSGQVMGNELPLVLSRNDINTIPWTALSGYYPMSVYTYTNTDDASGNGNQGALRNLNTVDRQTSPLPYETTQNGDWDINATWTNGNVQYIPGSTSIVDPNITIDWNIVRTAHNITIDNSSLPAVKNDNRKVLGLYVQANELTLNGDNSMHMGNAITVSHYLSLTGKIDLEGESQLIQELNSDLDVAISGELEKDQQGTADTYTYNYWSAPVGETDLAKNDYRYTVQDIMLDGTNPINFSATGYNGAATNPIQIADYWIWKFANQSSGDYSQWQHVRRTGTINAGEGFTMKGPGTGTILTDQNYVFLGKPNNGDINLTVNAGNDYLVGNPYASAIDANQFIIDNGPELNYEPGTDPTPLLSGTLYFWEHWGGGSHLLAEYQGGYATYNFSGAVAAASLGTNDPDVGTGGTPTKLPGRYIPVGQGFFVVGENTGTINFNNGQRIFQKEGNPASIFVRDANAISSQTNQNTDDRIKLRLGFNSVNTLHRQLLLTIDENSTPEVDWAYDAILNETQMDDMFWIIDNKEYVIQASNQADGGTVYPIGIKTDSDGTNTITIDELENVPNDLDIYLHDMELDLYHNLKESDYNIFLNAGNYLDRFEITFVAEAGVLGIDDQNKNAIDVLYSNDIEKIILINPNLLEVKSIELFNMLGQSVYANEDISESGYSEYDVKNLSTGTYIIKLYADSGSVTTKKVLVK